MATKSRTYLPTDWQLWTYIPVAGKFRLDFSALDGSDVLGAVGDTGSIGALSLNIGNIQLDDGIQPSQGVLFSFNPGTMQVQATMRTWDATNIKELYNGKQIYLTLKNEATNSHPTFGKNTVMFIGYIDSLEINLDPINRMTTLSISAVDVLSAAMNYPVAIAKSTVTGKATQVSNAITTARDAGQISPWISVALYGFMASTYETNTTESKSIGDWVTDYLASEVAGIYPGYFTNYGGGTWDVNRAITAYTISSTATTGIESFTDAETTNLVVTQDGANTPTAFNISNASGSYTFGDNSSNILGNPSIYTATIDVPTAFLQNIAAKIQQYVPKIQPTEIEIKTAQTYQTITFDNSRALFGTDYFFPANLKRNGQEVKTQPGYIGGTYYHRIVGTSHRITPDDWTTTYQLWKGL